jgi:HAMP domain-containing protein
MNDVWITERLTEIVQVQADIINQMYILLKQHTEIEEIERLEKEAKEMRDVIGINQEAKDTERG